MNFTLDDLGDTLTRAGFQRSLKTHFHWEAVAPYLEPAVVASVLSSLPTLGGLGSTVAWDLSEDPALARQLTAEQRNMKLKKSFDYIYINVSLVQSINVDTWSPNSLVNQ
jgi:O-methyltransferase involved in polyketide biosynthesis